MNPIWLNYAMLLQFAVLAIVWYCCGQKMQALYWLGAFLCTAGVTF